MKSKILENQYGVVSTFYRTVRKGMENLRDQSGTVSKAQSLQFTDIQVRRAKQSGSENGAFLFSAVQSNQNFCLQNLYWYEFYYFFWSNSYDILKQIRERLKIGFEDYSYRPLSWSKIEELW